MITTLTGNNTFALRIRLDELTKQFVKEHGDLALEKIDAVEVEKSAILEALQSLPFLSAKKMVIIRDLGANKAAAEAIEQIIDSVDEQTDLIIVEPAPDRRGKYYKSLQRDTVLETFNDLDVPDLAKWAVEEAKKLGGSLPAAEAAYLVDRLGANQLLLASELNKLIIYSPKITKATIDLLVEPTPQTKVFDLLDSAFSGDRDSALKLYQQQRAQKVEPQVILAMIAWQLRSLLAVKLGQGKTSAQVASDFSLNPYAAGKSSRLASNISGSRLKSLVEDALEMDYKSKTITYDLDEALKNYLVTIS